MILIAGLFQSYKTGGAREWWQLRLVCHHWWRENFCKENPPMRPSPPGPDPGLVCPPHLPLHLVRFPKTPSIIYFIKIA